MTKSMTTIVLKSMSGYALPRSIIYATSFLVVQEA